MMADQTRVYNYTNLIDVHSMQTILTFNVLVFSHANSFFLSFPLWVMTQYDWN